MGIYKKGYFTPITPVSGMSNDESDYTAKMWTLMNTIKEASKGSHKGSGLWYVVKHVHQIGKDPDSQGEYFLGFFPKKNDGTINDEYMAAPCPPFCEDPVGDAPPASGKTTVDSKGTVTINININTK